MSPRVNKAVWKLLCCWLALLAACYGFGSYSRSDGDRVYVNGVLVLSLHYGDSGVLSRRASWIALRLRSLDAESALALKVGERGAAITSDGNELISVSQEEAHAQGQSPEDLATTWLNNLRRALSMPPLKLASDDLKMPPGAGAHVNLLGSQIGSAEVQVSPRNVVSCSLENGTLQVHALDVGTATITVSTGDASDTLNVYVLPYATSLPQTLRVEVTGDPCTAETVEGAVEGALATKLRCQPSAELEYTPPSVPALTLESSASLYVPIKVTAPDSFPVQGKVGVEVRNVPLASRREAELWYCNDPEKLSNPEPLFVQELEPGRPARLLYHHINDSYRPLVVEVHALNDSDRDAKMMIIPGDSPPDRNPVLAGFRAADQFLRNWIKNSGEIVDLPAHSEIPIALHKLAPQQTMSGLCYLRLLGDGPPHVTVRTDAISPMSLDPSFAAAFDGYAPWRTLGPLPIRSSVNDGPLSQDVYPSPFRTQDILYTVGGKYGFARIGHGAIDRADHHDTLDGNFGVIYTINAELVNSTSFPAEVQIVFEASAGYSAGLFFMNGNLIRTPLLQPKEETELSRVRLQPGEDRHITILTCPLSGGSYPATLTIRPVGGVGNGYRTSGYSGAPN